MDVDRPGQAGPVDVGPQPCRELRPSLAVVMNASGVSTSVRAARAAAMDSALANSVPPVATSS